MFDNVKSYSQLMEEERGALRTKLALTKKMLEELMGEVGDAQTKKGVYIDFKLQEILCQITKK